MNPPLDPTRPTAPPRQVWGPRTSRVPYNEDDLTFCMLVYEDHERAVWCLENLRRSYPEARVIVISDGDPDPRHETLAQRFGVRYVAGERLYPVANGGRLIARMFDLFLEQPTRWFFKIDTDTGIYRRFRPLPGEADLFGDWARIETRCLQGGCIGIARSAVERMHASRLLLGPELLDPRTSWARDLDGSLIPACVERAEQQGLIAFEFVLTWCAHRLGLEIEQFLDIRSEWKFRPSNPEDVFAVVHPIKDLVLRR